MVHTLVTLSLRAKALYSPIHTLSHTDISSAAEHWRQPLTPGAMWGPPSYLKTLRHMRPNLQSSNQRPTALPMQHDPTILKSSYLNFTKHVSYRQSQLLQQFYHISSSQMMALQHHSSF